MFCLRIKLRIRLLQEVIGSGARLHVRAVVDELADRNARRQFGHPAEVIAMPVSRDQMVDLREPCIFHRGHDALGVANRPCASIACIDQQRLAGW